MPLLGLALTGALLAPSPGHAQSYGDPAEGRRLAAAWCSDCHQIDPTAQTLANDAVPSYQAIAARPSTTMTSLRVFLSTSHEVMPNLQLTEQQIGDVGAYILSLRARAQD